LEQPHTGNAALTLTASDGSTTRGAAVSDNVIGGYFHAHLASNPEAAGAFVEAYRCGGRAAPAPRSRIEM